MATRKSPVTPENEQVQQMAAQLLALGDDTTEAESLNPALEALYAELGMADGGEATVHVSKLDADGRGTEAQIWKGDPDQYDLESIAKKFGSGQYRVRVYVRIPSGQKVLKGNKVFAWLLSPEDEAKRVQTNTSTPAPQIDMRAEIARIVAETVKAAMPPAPVNTPDPMGMLSGLADVIAKIRPESSAPVAPPMNPISMLKDMAELMTTMRGDAEPITQGANASGNDLMLALINKFGPLLGQVVQTQQHAPMPQTAAPAQQSPAPHVPTAQTPMAQQTEGDDVSLKLRMGLMFLVQQCEAGGAPETYAEVVLDSVPAEALQQLLNSPAPIDRLAEFLPAIRIHEAWFQSLIDECKEILASQDEPETPSIDKAQG